MRTSIWSLAVILIVGFAASARADVVHLTNGGSIEGQVSEENGIVTVTLPQGVVKFPRSTVQSIERREAPLDVYARKRAALPAGDAAARIELARWALSERMQHQARELFREALELDPANPEARVGLGLALEGKSELTPEEKLISLGLSRFEGQWMSPEAVSRLEHARSDAQSARTEAEFLRAQTEASAAQLAARQAELEAIRAQSEQLVTLAQEQARAGQTQLAALESEFARLTVRHQGLEADNIRLQDEHKALAGERDRLQAEYAALAARLEQLEAELRARAAEDIQDE